jgi:hypothetical protein
MVALGQPADDVGAPGGEQPAADFDRAHRAAQVVGEGEGGRRAVHIQGNNDGIGGDHLCQSLFICTVFTRSETRSTPCRRR